MLRDLGYDDSVGDLLAEEAHFLPGHHQVTLIINGQQKGSKDLTFDRQGKACWSSALLEELGITPRAFTSAAESDCLIPAPENNITVIEHPDRNSLELKVPPDGLQDRLHYASGGKALILNYDANVYRYQRQSANSATNQTLTSEAGINFNDWIVRSGQSFSTWGGKKDFSRLYTYTQKTFTNLSSVLQAGEISTNDPVFGGINLTGAQLFPEMALQGGSNHATIDTVIPLAATVEVWQRDILLKSFRLPAGAVTLEDIPVLNRQDDFILKIRDDAGGEQQQIIPYVQARTARVFSSTGLSLAAGQLRLSSEKFPLATASAGVYQNTRLSLVSGGLVSQDYQSAAWRADIRLTETLLSTLTQTLSLAKDSQEQSGHVKGIKNQASLAYPVTGHLSANAVASFYSKNFLEPGSAMTYR
ncbi:fimbria/pilus outer membrane usher protein [Pantoea sp. BAV 3049]|uniref:fimbria/pilus outer membrane usher protein n=1 Tax=Pantoea sp. BAV 3049 TaxID=2654188 RepID=UPI00131B8B90|nr:fimbria/pilus outer membrane usher protein [Pantoea sp. BAV 3049]